MHVNVRCNASAPEMVPVQGMDEPLDENRMNLRDHSNLLYSHANPLFILLYTTNNSAYIIIQL